MQRTSVLALLGAMVVMACGNEVVVLSDGDGGSSTTPPSTSSGHGGGTGGTGNGGAGATGGTGGTGGMGGSPGCGRSYDGFDMQLVTFDQTVWGCYAPEGTAAGYQEIEGQVVELLENGIVLDSCPPNADCIPMLNFLSFWALDLYNPVPFGAFVRVSVQVDQPWGCTHQLMIENLPSWGGLPNPVYPGEMLYLAAADGAPAALPGAPFEISPVALGCFPNAEPNCGYEEDYALRFSSPFGEPIDVYMGELWDWYLQSSDLQYLLVRNLRSYETGWCDDYWNWGYWVSGGLMLDDF